MSVLGEGEFGVVMKAEAYGINSAAEWSTVAVKMLKSTCYHCNPNTYLLTYLFAYLLFVGLLRTLSCYITGLFSWRFGL